ncbi:MAG: hypothetical protein WBP93_20395 [Pyrinomonadaceae bacterium]
MEKRIISAGVTFFNKILGLPFIFLSILFMWRWDFLDPYILINLVYLSILFLRSAFRLKRVSIDGEHLYVTNFLKGVVIPLSEIEAVTGGKWYRPFLTIHLRHPTEFGKKIVFMPRHPIADELRESGKEARRKQLLADSSDETSGLAFDNEQHRDTSAR